ncbi:MAG: hypothetical protein AVDCRST_MAG30-4455 [uncultured Solirubrobacteraceae bacterium]|uniref:Uncharacterized protein n=1 Tax=uncultured Solirubrobacteraceae bacterium TaxID=1162706 RepID=A0A6J4U1A3_9ACTN|nr:MAG: hypothetical protein AVDCRST_MAG30-4455 [uncultured Solirubrobacteraceae bacterium]
MSERSYADVHWDGVRLSPGAGPGRRFGIDPRCLAGGGRGVAGAWAHVCASPDPAARILFDAPEVQQVRRDALAWWIDLLGDDLVCLSTLTLDSSHYGGAITVARSRAHFAWDPFARLFAGVAVATDAFAPVAPPPGPVLERYAGAPWPAGSFADSSSSRPYSVT